MKPETGQGVETLPLPIRTSFGTAIGCMDGRTIQPVADFVEKLDPEIGFVDSITRAGVVGKLAEPEKNKELVAEIEAQTEISLKHHKSKVICVYGHEGCAGHPVADAIHQEDVIKAAETVANFKAVAQANVPVIPLFVAKEETPQKRQIWFVEILRKRQPAQKVA